MIHVVLLYLYDFRYYMRHVKTCIDAPTFKLRYNCKRGGKMEWKEPIIDRKKEDVDRVEEYDQVGYKYLLEEQKEEWLRGMKGALNATDLNRIESNQQYILRLLNDSYTLPYKDNWEMTDFVNEEDEERILLNLKSLIQPFDLGEIDIPNKPLNYFEKINTIEYLLKKMYDKYNTHGESLRGGFLTNQDEEFITSNDEDLIVYCEKI